MPRGRKKTTIPVETPVSTAKSADLTAEASIATTETGTVADPATPADESVWSAELGATALVTASPPRAVEEPIRAEAVPDAAETPASAPRDRFRSWVVDSGRGYRRMTDETEQRIILQFREKPAADVLTAVKGAGFQFLADYEGLNHVWVRRNDFETRLQVEAIEKLIGSLPQRDSAAR